MNRTGTPLPAITALFEDADAAGLRVFHKERNQWGCKGYKASADAVRDLPHSRSLSIDAMHTHVQCLPGLATFVLLPQADCLTHRNL
jgi:hypothetical protein